MIISLSYRKSFIGFPCPGEKVQIAQCACLRSGSPESRAWAIDLDGGSLFETWFQRIERGNQNETEKKEKSIPILLLRSFLGWAAGARSPQDIWGPYGVSSELSPMAGPTDSISIGWTAVSRSGLPRLCSRQTSSCSSAQGTSGSRTQTQAEWTTHSPATLIFLDSPRCTCVLLLLFFVHLIPLTLFSSKFLDQIFPPPGNLPWLLLHSLQCVHV